MGIQFNWFKDVEVVENKIEMGMFSYTQNYIKFIDGDGCNHSSGNVGFLQEIFEKYGNINIPYLPTYMDCTREEIISDILIPKEKVIEICEKFLNNPNEKDEYDMRDRIEWIKKKSEEGYYVAYEGFY